MPFLQVRSLSTAAAKLLVGRGIEPEHVVGICIDEGVRMILVQLAVLIAGAAFVPIDLHQPHR